MSALAAAPTVRARAISPAPAGDASSSCPYTGTSKEEPPPEREREAAAAAAAGRHGQLVRECESEPRQQRSADQRRLLRRRFVGSVNAREARTREAVTRPQPVHAARLCAKGEQPVVGS